MSFAYQHQNDFLPAPATCTGSGVNTSSPRCAGSQSAVSFQMDYKPVPRADLYGGMMISNVYGGLASGFFKSQTSTRPSACESDSEAATARLYGLLSRQPLSQSSGSRLRPSLSLVTSGRAVDL
jgi:hypothetical protein